MWEMPMIKMYLYLLYMALWQRYLSSGPCFVQYAICSMHWHHCTVHASARLKYSIMEQLIASLVHTNLIAIKKNCDDKDILEMKIKNLEKWERKNKAIIRSMIWRFLNFSFHSVAFGDFFFFDFWQENHSSSFEHQLWLRNSTWKEEIGENGFFPRKKSTKMKKIEKKNSEKIGKIQKNSLKTSLSAESVLPTLVR